MLLVMPIFVKVEKKIFVFKNIGIKCVDRASVFCSRRGCLFFENSVINKIIFSPQFAFNGSIYSSSSVSYIFYIIIRQA